MSKEERIYRLLQEHPEYREILERALAIEDNPPNEFVKNYGWEWSDVKAHPAKLIKLVTEGVLDIKYKSRRYTHYKLTDKEAVRKALKSYSIK
jgi:hypothetical protein